MVFDHQAFFSGYRTAFGSLDQSQASGLEFLLSKLELDTFSPKQVAYILATTDHETAHTFQPVRERRGRPGTKIRKVQDKYWGSGYYGRGYCQITWERNYRLFAQKLGVDLVNNPDIALEPEIAYQIMSLGMREGLFTGRKLSDYID